NSRSCECGHSLFEFHHWGFSPTHHPCPGEASVSFRGRSLKGKQSSLPKGYVGLVLEETALLLASKEREVSVKSTFDSLTVWNLERAPTNSDEILMALAWPAIAQGIHAPVTDEE
ncbi:ribonuclease H2 subunit C, partial [Python bivittatus]|uniref:Ribonuclease H2 subunit C n=1 Tax=Python bivittatus TaxID=176946 RepID=A0A9F5JCC3_PYTBI